MLPRTFGAAHPLWADGVSKYYWGPAPGFVSTNPGVASGWRECPRYNNVDGIVWSGAVPVYSCAGIPGAHTCRE